MNLAQSRKPRSGCPESISTAVADQRRNRPEAAVVMDSGLATSSRPGMTLESTMEFFSSLPIDPALPALGAALSAHNAAVLVAPPGAGKTTRVPLVLAQADWARGRRIL